jgi:hypothetical protein
MTDYLMKPISDCAFCAHDDNETRVTFDKYCGKWWLTDIRGVSIEFDNLMDALGNMSIITDTPMNQLSVF